MLNPQKIKWMTKASMYEQKEEKGMLRMNRYFPGDYICYGMIKSAIGVTCSAVLIAGVWLLIHAEELLTMTPFEDLTAKGLNMLFYYIAALVIWLVVSFFVYLIRYRRMQKSLKEYLTCLKKIKKMQDKEKRETETVREEQETW